MTPSAAFLAHTPNPLGPPEVCRVSGRAPSTVFTAGIPEALEVATLNPASTEDQQAA